MPELRLRAGAPEREAPSPAVGRLRRLRLSLTLLFTVALALGLAALAVLVIHKDSEARLDSLQGTMGRRVTGSSRLIYFSNRGRLRLNGLHGDDLAAGNPEIRVFAGTGRRPRPVFAGVRDRLPVSYADLAAIAHRAATSEGIVATTVTDRDGTRVRLLAGPYFGAAGGSAAGAVVSAASLAGNESAHRELEATIVISCAALLVLAGGAGYLLAGRSLRPAARSIAQQESLLADAAHELRTPIASVRATLEAAQLDPATMPAAVEEARATTARMGDTVAALLAWGRLEAGAEQAAHTELRLDQLVEDVAADLDPGGQIALEAETAIVLGDPTLIRIAVRNLLDNALRHGGGGRVGEDDGDGDGSGSVPPVTVTVSAGTVAVADRGPGLDAADLTDGRVRRYRSGSADGAGLGLSIAARIAALHGGELTARSRDGGGSELILTLDAPA